MASEVKVTPGAYVLSRDILRAESSGSVDLPKNSVVYDYTGESAPMTLSGCHIYTRAEDGKGEPLHFSNAAVKPCGMTKHES